MNLMQKIGLGVFLASLLTLFAILTIGEYQLSELVIQNQFNDKTKVENSLKTKSLIQSATEIGLLNKIYHNQFSFNADLEKAVIQANKAIIAQLGFSENDIVVLKKTSISEGVVTYNEKLVQQLFSDENKRKLLADNTSWMYEREWNSSDEFWSQLSEKLTNIEYSVVSSNGIKENSETWFAITKASSQGLLLENASLFAVICFLLGALGALMYILPQLKDGPAGIKNNGIFFHAAMNRGWIGVIIGTFLISFYIFMYWFPQYIVNWVILVQPLYSYISDGREASQWFLYGLLYCIAMLVMGTRMVIKYRHNKYQVVRSISVVFFQLGFAFIIPEILMNLNSGAGWAWVDLKNMWPLDYDFFNNGGLIEYAKNEGGQVVEPVINGGKIGLSILIWGIVLFVVGVPLMVYFFGKRWYCSWVCGCGGLAETLGDPFRHLSDKSLKAWKIERWMIHSVLVFAIIMTGLSIYTLFTAEWKVLGIETATIQKTYGFLIGSVFSGVVGTGFYPLMGNRVWCRFGCPLAAYLGIIQRFKSRFRITTNGGQCISCGNCSTYCEQGIDVRAYAQKGENIVRSSCVGCGICSAVCPRGVLKLENGPEEGRITSDPLIISKEGISVNQKIS